MLENLKNKRISTRCCFVIILLLSVLLSIFTICKCDSLEIILKYLASFLNEQYLYTFFGVVFGGFIALFAFLGLVITERTKYLVEKILFNPSYINLSQTADKEYKLWVYSSIFNADILRFLDWKEMKGLLKPVLYTGKKDINGERELNYEGEYYKIAFYRFKNITKNFINFLRTTVFLLFTSLVSLFLIFFSDVHYIKLAIGLLAIIVFLSSLFALTFAALVIKSLFIAPQEMVKKLKKELSEE